MLRAFSRQVAPRLLYVQSRSEYSYARHEEYVEAQVLGRRPRIRWPADVLRGSPADLGPAARFLEDRFDALAAEVERVEYLLRQAYPMAKEKTRPVDETAEEEKEKIRVRQQRPKYPTASQKDLMRAMSILANSKQRVDLNYTDAVVRVFRGCQIIRLVTAAL